jgi:hypothetical protein
MRSRQWCSDLRGWQAFCVAMAARGWADLDWSALGLLAAVDAGLDDGH